MHTFPAFERQKQIRNVWKTPTNSWEWVGQEFQKKCLRGFSFAASGPFCSFWQKLTKLVPTNSSEDSEGPKCSFRPWICKTETNAMFEKHQKTAENDLVNNFRKNTLLSLQVDHFCCFQQKCQLNEFWIIWGQWKNIPCNGIQQHFFTQLIASTNKTSCFWNKQREYSFLPYQTRERKCKWKVLLTISNVSVFVHWCGFPSVEQGILFIADKGFCCKEKLELLFESFSFCLKIKKKKFLEWTLWMPVFQICLIRNPPPPKFSPIVFFLSWTVQSFWPVLALLFCASVLIKTLPTLALICVHVVKLLVMSSILKSFSLKCSADQKVMTPLLHRNQSTEPESQCWPGWNQCSDSLSVGTVCRYLHHTRQLTSWTHQKVNTG